MEKAFAHCVPKATFNKIFDNFLSQHNTYIR